MSTKATVLFVSRMEKGPKSMVQMESRSKLRKVTLLSMALWDMPLSVSRLLKKVLFELPSWSTYQCTAS